MKTCDQAAELLPALAEDVLAPAEAQEVRAHIATCGACAESWKVQETISRHFRETDLAEKPDYFWARQRKHILQEVGFGTTRFERAEPARRRAIGYAIAAAAAAVLVVGVFAILKNGNTEPTGPNIVRDPHPAPVKEIPLVQDPPEKPVETPVENSKPAEQYGEKPDTQNQPDAPPPQKDIVQEPAPKTEPKPEPPKDKPKDEIVQPIPPPKEGTTSKDPVKDAPAVPKPEAVAILPGHVKYPARLAQEQAEILMPVTADTKAPLVKERDTIEQALAVLKSARGRLDDMTALIANDPKADLTEMVDAYAILVGEGAGPMLFRINATGVVLGGARLELKAQKHVLDGFPEDLRKGTLLPAIQACAAANDYKGRLHKDRTRGAEFGALIAARETVGFLKDLAGGTPTVDIRMGSGFAFAGRYLTATLEQARLGRLPEAEAEYEGYQRLVDVVVRIFEWQDAKDAPRVGAAARRHLITFVNKFKSFRGLAAARFLMEAAITWTSEKIERVTLIEGSISGKLPKPPERKDPPPPAPKDPPPPPPPAPPFGETPPPSPPPPPPEGFDDPK